MWAKPTRRAKSSVSLKSSSVSPGKPAIRSVVMVSPGIAARSRPRPAPQSPPPDCVAPSVAGLCRCPIGRAGAGAASAGSGYPPTDRRSWLTGRTVPATTAAAANERLSQQRTHQRAQILAEIAPIASQMHTGQHGFLVTLGVQCVYLGHDLGDPPAAFISPRHGHDTEGAVIAAAVLGFDEGAGASSGCSDVRGA